MDPQIFQAASELIFQKFRSHAMTAGRDILRGENPRLNVFAKEVFIRVTRHRSIRRQVTALGAHHDLLAFESFCCKLLEGSADASLAALKSVVYGGAAHT